MKKSITEFFNKWGGVQKTSSLLIFLFTLIFASCSNLFTSQESLPSNTKIHFTGTLCITGAVPSSLKETCHAELDSASLSRSALPSYNIGNEYYYYVTATQTDGSGTFNINSIDNSDSFNTSSDVTFALELTTGKWNIECGIKKAASSGQVSENDVTVMSDTYPATISTVAPVLNHTFYPKPSQSGEGTVELKISVYSAIPNFGRVTASCSKSVWAEKVSGPVYDDGQWIIQTSNTLPSGTYEVAFNFYNTSDILLYSTVQTINVFDNMLTNTWVSDGSGAIDGDGTFALSNNLVTSFSRTTFYVGDTGVGKEPSDTEGTGSPYTPLKTISKAVQIIQRINDGSSFYRLYICEDQDLSDLTGSLSLVPADKAIKLLIQGYDAEDSGKKIILSGYNESSQKSQFNGAFITIAGKSNTETIVTLRNLSIYGHKNTLSSASNGGGLLCSQANVSLENVDIRENECGEKGGGIFASTSSIVTIKDSYIQGNKATNPDGAFGGGIALMGGATVYIEGNTHILENESANGGGGIGVSATGSNKLYINDGHIYANTAVNGGGVFNAKELYFSAGGISQNTATTAGGGVYSTGSLFMYGSAVIGDSSKTTAATDTTETGCSNKAVYGAGIYSLGNLYLGYSDADTETELTGGVFYNFSHDTGGIYQYANKTFLMNSGFVSYNAGRGIYVGNCSFTMSGGSVSGNTTFEPNDNNYQTNGAGIYAGLDSTVLISGGTISGNEAGRDGGGLYIAKPETSVTISGGTISGNTADGNGNGIALMNGALKMQDGASVDSNNDVYLASEKYIEITDALSATSSVATLTPENYTDGTTVLEAESGVNLADEVGKFEVVPDGSTQYYIASDGKMYNYKPVAQFTTVPAAGDTAGLATMDDFEKVAEWVDAGNELTGVTLILLNNVTLDSSFTPIGEYYNDWEVDESKVRKLFTGIFEGNNKTITYDSVSFTQEYSGIFSGAKNATIQNVNLEGTLNINTEYTGGALIGHAESCTIKNCSSSVNITAGSSAKYYLGGIVGTAEGSYIADQKRERNCYILDCVNTGSITGDSVNYIGGIVGYASVCVIRNCINKGDITGVKSCGGIVGSTSLSGPDGYGCLIENCGNNGNITANGNNSDYTSGAGGIAGGPDASNSDWYPHINNCYSSGTITAKNDKAGGIFGYKTNRCTLSKCYYHNPGQACQDGSPSGSSQYTNVSSILNDMNSLNNSDSATYRRWKVSGSVLGI